MKRLLGLLRNSLFLTALAVLGCASTTSICGCYSESCEHTSTCEVVDQCPGQCVPLPPLGFDGPSLLWVGRQADAPGCPARAPKPVYQGFEGLDDSNQCPACSCTEPACVLPSGVTASTLNVCPNDGPGATLMPFDAPAGWTGSCTSPATIPASLLGSVSIAPVTAQPCAPVPPEVPQGGDALSPWSTFAQACAGEAIDNVCGDPGLTCLPTAEPPPPGFRQCIFYLKEGDPTCPDDYPEKLTFYGGLEDTRECSKCACTETAASTCEAIISTYQGADCTSLLVSVMMGAVELCLDVMPGAQLGSMEAMWTKDQPGSCAASGGVPSGEAKPLDPSTFCCQPPP